MRIFILLLFIVSVALYVGCHRGPARPADLPALHLVSITITQNGTPLPGAAVVLTAKTQQTYRTASGTTDDSGVVVPRTHGFDGVPAGAYTVSVSKTAIEGGTQQMDGNTPITVGGKIYQYVEEDYLNASTSPLSVDVSARMETTLDVGAAVHVFIADNVRD